MVKLCGEIVVNSGHMLPTTPLRSYQYKTAAASVSLSVAELLLVMGKVRKPHCSSKYKGFYEAATADNIPSAPFGSV